MDSFGRLDSKAHQATDRCLKMCQIRGPQDTADDKEHHWSSERSWGNHMDQNKGVLKMVFVVLRCQNAIILYDVS